MTILAAVVFSVLMAALAVFQAALATGAPLGHFAWGGQHQRLPTVLRVGSVLSIVIYAVFASLVLQAAGIIVVWPAAWVMTGVWIVVGYCTIGIPTNAISRSRPERLAMTPLVAVLLVCALIVALNG